MCPAWWRGGVPATPPPYRAPCCRAAWPLCPPGLTSTLLNTRTHTHVHRRLVEGRLAGVVFVVDAAELSAQSVRPAGE
jgi:hypothetical protein